MPARPYLGLAPTDPTARAGGDELLAALSGLGLFRAPFGQSGKDHYLLGDRFTTLISFLGCMPYLVLDPVDEDEQPAGFCYGQLVIADRPTLFVDRFTRVLRCADCGERMRWEPELVEDAGVRCASCHGVMGWHGMRLGDSGALASVAVLLHGVHRAEAVPSPSLLHALAALTPGSAWRYFYAERQ